MKIIQGKYFDGQTPVSVDAEMAITGQAVTLTTRTETIDSSLSQLMVSPRVASARRFISFHEGMQFICEDQPFLDSLPQESPSEGIVAWLENRFKVAVLCVAATIIMLAAGYFLGLPLLAAKLADRIPMQKEQDLGEEVLAYFDQNGWVRETKLDATLRVKIQDGFNLLCKDLPFEDYYWLEFRDSRMFGPNALALPGGIIIITDELIKMSESTEEVLAILAHEIGHVEKRHVMRSILQNSIVAAAVATITSDAATLSAAVTGIPTLLAQRKYSREFETDADDFAFDLLEAKGYSPAAFASMMDKLASEVDPDSGMFDYISTHPATRKRIERARRAAEVEAEKP